MTKEELINLLKDLKEKESVEKHSDDPLEEGFYKVEKNEAHDKVAEFYNVIRNNLTQEQEQIILSGFSEQEQKTMESRILGKLKGDFSNDEKTYAKLGNVQTLAEAKEILKDQMTEKEFTQKYRVSNGMSNREFTSKISNVLPDILNTYTQEQIDNFEKMSKEYKNYVDRNPDDPSITTQRYERELKEIKNDPKYNEIKDSRPDLQEALEYVGTIRKGNQTFKSALESKRQAIEVGVAHHSEKISDEQREKILVENGMKINEPNHKDFETIHLNGGFIEISHNDKLREHAEKTKLVYTDETKKNLRELFGKMEENGYYADGLVGEQDTKVYGFTKLNNIQDNLYGAMQNKDYDNIVKYANERKQEKEHIEDMFKTMEGKLPITKDNLDYGGNIDVARTESFDIDIRRDIPKASHFTGMYSILSSLKKNNITIDEFLEDPRGAIEKDINNFIKTHFDREEQVKGKTVGQQIFELSKNKLSTGFKEAMIAYPRMMESALRFENNKEARESNYVVEKDFNDVSFGKIQSMSECAENVIAKDEQFFKNLMLAGDKFNVNQLLTQPVYDPKTMKMTNVGKFDRAEYITKTEVDFKDLKSRLDSAMLDYMKECKQYDNRPDGRKIADLHSMTTHKVAKIAHELATEVCMLKRDEKDNPDYQALMEFVNNPVEYTNKLADQMENKERYKVSADDFTNVKDIDKKIDKYIKNNKNFGRETVNADKTLNTSLLNKAKDVNKKNARANESETFIKENIAKRKEQLEKDFKAGKITESYYKERTEQLDYNKILEAARTNKKLIDVPPMFKADKFPSKNDYIKSTDLEDLSKDEKDVLYAQAKQKAEMEKKEFLTRKYFEENKMMDGKNTRYTMQEIMEEQNKYEAEATIENGEVNKENNKDMEKEPLMTKIHVELEEEHALEDNEMVKDDALNVQKDKSKDGLLT